MDRNFKSQIKSRLHSHRASPMLALVIPAALAGVAISSYDASAASPRDVTHAAKAQAALKAGQADKAIVHAEAAVAADPLNADYRAMLGAAYIGAGRFMAAATSFEDAMDLGQEDARTVLSYALAKTAIGDGRVAVAALDDARGRLNAADYGLALALAGEANRGVQVLINAVRTEDPTPKLRQNLAYAYALSGNWRAARVMAAEDVPAGEVDARMVEWAANAAPEQFQQRVAGLLKVNPSDDLGQPASLALANFRSNSPMAAPMLADAEAAPVAIPVQPERLRQSEALAFGMDNAATQLPIERVDPTPVQIAAAPSEVPMPTPKAATAPSNQIRFVSNPVVQQLPQSQIRRASAAAPIAAPAPQRRMAATAAASNAPISTAPVVREAASDKNLDSHLVQLGSYNSKIEAERGWNLLKAKFPQLKEHDVVITEALVNGRTFFRVAAAGFGPKSAAGLCGTLRSAGRGCFAYAVTNPPAGAVDKGVRLAARSR
jgi:Flp pilus assembly protein TadD